MPATRDGKLWRSQFYYKDWQGVRRKKNKRVFMTKGERDLFYKPVPVSDVLTCFAEKTYLWPIDRSELEKNVRLTQNPGWQSEK